MKLHGNLWWLFLSIAIIDGEGGRKVRKLRQQVGSHRHREVLLKHKALFGQLQTDFPEADTHEVNTLNLELFHLNDN